MMKNKVQVFAPATVANVGPGFDVFGFSLNSPGDIVEASPNDMGEIRIIEVVGDGNQLPRDPKRNVVGHVAQRLLDNIAPNQGVDLRLEKGVPLSSGMGGSAASAVASVYAVNELFDQVLEKREMLPLAMEGERLVSGAPHADNVAPCLYGGFTVIRSYDPLDVVQIPVPANLFCVVVCPNYHIRTEDARNVLPKMIPLKTAVHQWGNTAALIAGLNQHDYELIGRAIEDLVAEPSRGPLIPAFEQVKTAALEAGALGCSISGSGPSVFALSNENDRAHKIGQAMQAAFVSQDLKSSIYVSKINTVGPRIL
jgi:homoserine kinase